MCVCVCVCVFVCVCEWSRSTQGNAILGMVNCIDQQPTVDG